ncbi:MAG TPA: hypothetical protein VHD90_02405 [Phototrophicaceae bacterium]|nr:hypothetical protein [Phototrophicaceae bacterium]
MSNLDHAAFIPHDFVTMPFGGQRKSCPQAMIHLHYDPVNFQHLSLIARMFNLAFVNHSDQGDLPGLAPVIEALPGITFALPDSHLSLQFATDDNSAEPDPSLGCDLSQFVEAAPCGVRVIWQETLLLRLDAEGKISERWQAPIQ